jgi:hypothetical protein
MSDPQPWWLTWPVAEVAAAILPWFAANPPEFEGFVMRHIVQWMQGAPSGSVGHRAIEQFTDPDIRAVAEAIQVLEHARLLMRSPGERAHVGLTRLGLQTLATNSVRQHLGLGDARPTA